MKLLKPILLALVCSTFYGCASYEPEFYPLNSNNDSVTFGDPRAANEVELFITNRPDYKYKELGIITYSVPSSFSDDIEVYTKIKTLAGQIGADAVIMMPSQSELYQMPNVALDYYGNPMPSEVTRSFVKFRGMAIDKIQPTTSEKSSVKANVVEKYTKPLEPVKSVKMPNSNKTEVTVPPLNIKTFEQSPQAIENGN